MSSLPSSPITIYQSPVPPPWNHSLSESFKKNHQNENYQIYLPMSNTRRSGDTSMHCLLLKGFLEGYHLQYFKFVLAMNDHTLMGDVKSDRNGRITWVMPLTQEYYHFKGKFYIASSPTQVTRYPPPKVPEDDDYWEKQRIQLWDGLDKKTKATFSWPSKRDKPKETNTMPEITNIEMAKDNFCLLLYKVTEVEHFDYSLFPPKRKVYALESKSNVWKVDTVNP